MKDQPLRLNVPWGRRPVIVVTDWIPREDTGAHFPEKFSGGIIPPKPPRLHTDYNTGQKRKERRASDALKECNK